MRSDKEYFEDGSLLLAPKVATLHQRFSANPSTIINPATPLTYCQTEVSE